jgi:hypothetical protein
VEKTANRVLTVRFEKLGLLRLDSIQFVLFSLDLQFMKGGGSGNLIGCLDKWILD